MRINPEAAAAGAHCYTMASPSATSSSSTAHPSISYPAYIWQVATEVGPLLLVIHTLGAALAVMANPGLTGSDVTPLGWSLLLVAVTHAAPQTTSLAAASLKAATIPTAVAGFIVEALVRADRRAAAGGALGWLRPPLPAGAATVAGWASIVAGGALLVWTVAFFHTRGSGTLSPETATQPTALVVDGPYRVVRNPMITGVLLLLGGQAVVRGSPRVAAFAVAFGALKHAFFVCVEEPALARRYGAVYAAYTRATPRWLPALWGSNKRA